MHALNTLIPLFSALEISLQCVFILEKKFTAHCKKEKKVIGHHTRLKEYDDLPCAPLGVPALRQKPQCFNVRALLLMKIVRSKDAQCSAKE